MSTTPSRERRDVEKDWPDHVWGITLDDLDSLGLDQERNLYWNGKPIEVRKSFDLKFWQKVGAVILTASAAVAAIAAGISAYVDLMGSPLR